jgi:hypothetical protein
MKRRLLSALLAGCIVFLTSAAFAGSGRTCGADARKFGAKVTVKKAVDIARLAKDPARFAGRTVRLEGTVKEVCQGRGCWVEVEANGISFLARSLDETVLLPKDCKGRPVVVQGVVKALPASVKEEPVEGGHACPKPEWVVATQGVELR